MISVERITRTNDETVLVRCTQCDKEEEIDITTDELHRWCTGELLQKVIPFVASDKRELLISGICGRCFDRMFGEDE